MTTFVVLGRSQLPSLSTTTTPGGTTGLQHRRSHCRQRCSSCRPSVRRTATGTRARSGLRCRHCTRYHLRRCPQWAAWRSTLEVGGFRTWLYGVYSIINTSPGNGHYTNCSQAKKKRDVWWIRNLKRCRILEMITTVCWRKFTIGNSRKNHATGDQNIRRTKTTGFIRRNSATAEIARVVSHKPYIAKNYNSLGYISVANSMGLSSRI